jgi:hypothetical protein
LGCWGGRGGGRRHRQLSTPTMALVDGPPGSIPAWAMSSSGEGSNEPGRGGSGCRCCWPCPWPIAASMEADGRFATSPCWEAFPTGSSRHCLPARGVPDRAQQTLPPSERRSPSNRASRSAASVGGPMDRSCNGRPRLLGTLRPVPSGRSAGHLYQVAGGGLPSQGPRRPWRMQSHSTLSGLAVPASGRSMSSVPPWPLPDHSATQ